MSDIFYPFKSDNKEIFIASSSKGIDIKASDITEDYRKKLEIDFFDKINLDIKKAIFMNQVHKDNIVKIDENNKDIYSKENPVKETDALITNLKNIPLVIQTADCLPVILYCKESKSMAAIHSGWRGTVQRIIPKTIESMKKEYNIDTRTIYAYIGAHIFEKDYEVGEEVAIHFRAKRIINGKWHVDNGTEAVLQMIDLGLSEENIEVSNLNSYNEIFYSYRRDGKQIGRILTVGMIL